MSHAQKMEVLGSLVDGITHELNNLLTVVSINAELLRDRIEPQESDPLARICDASDQAASLSRRLRALISDRIRAPGSVGAHVMGSSRSRAGR